MANPSYNRKGFGLKDQVRPEIVAEYDGGLIPQIREQGYKYQRGNVTVHLAEAFGFCWGVDRAVSMAYETRRHYPDKTIWITNEIIHNPMVNAKLKEMGIKFLDLDEQDNPKIKDLGIVGEGDVVILPAFGAAVKEMEALENRDIAIVDTTCPWVARVWNRVAKYENANFTAIIHGKYAHEETIATASRAHCYLTVLNLEEAQWVCDYILHGGDKAVFLDKFEHAHSLDFDPDVDLERVGVANQTTMLQGETEQIGKLFERTMLEKYGPQALSEHYMSAGDTICNATQERQDAMLKLVEEPLELIIVVGGFNSSNTSHLHEIGLRQGFRSYHIDSPNRIGPGNRIEHKPLEASHRGPFTVEENWLRAHPVKIGITSGASTPDRVVSEILEKVFMLHETLNAG